MKAKKSFGQHFLKEDAVAERIANGLKQLSAYNDILEIGPGKGMLTKFLIPKEQQLKVVEADRDMVTYLKRHYPDLQIIADDFLKVPLEQHFDDQFGLIGNFPYNISSQILIKLIKYRDRIPEMVGMFQKEMADRVVAGPGSKTFGGISVLVQAFYDAEYLFTVKPGSFNPPPKVKSAVIRLTRKANYELGVSAELFRIVVRTSFGQRRKMLRNTMKALLKGSPILQDEIFNKRPEQLAVEDFVLLTRHVEEYRKANNGDVKE